MPCQTRSLALNWRFALARLVGAEYRVTGPAGSWKAGDTGARFPGGEDCQELCARLRRALAAVSSKAGDATSLVVAHGANLRAALPGLTGDPDPGVDLPTGGVAAMRVDPGHLLDASVQRLSWPGTASSDRRRGQGRGSA